MPSKPLRAKWESLSSVTAARGPTGARFAHRALRIWDLLIRLAGGTCWRMRWQLLARWILCLARLIDKESRLGGKKGGEAAFRYGNVYIVCTACR